jgi:hypothetical protein
MERRWVWESCLQVREGNFKPGYNRVAGVPDLDKVELVAFFPALSVRTPKKRE